MHYIFTFQFVFTKPYQISPEHLEYTTRIAWDHSVILSVFFKKIYADSYSLPLHEGVQAEHFFFFSFCGKKKKERRTVLEQHMMST